MFPYRTNALTLQMVMLLIPRFIEMTTIPNPPKDMHPAIERVFNGRVYSLYPGRKLQWFVAQRLCELSQGQLAVPDSEEVYIFIRDMIREYFVKLNNTERMDMNGFHLGIRYVDNTWIPAKLDWCHGEPKFQGSCAEFSTLNGFCINDYSCKEHRKRGIICENPLFTVDQPERGLIDQRVICLKPLNRTNRNGRASWLESDEWCRSMKMTLTHPSLFRDKPCGGLYKKAPTAVNVNSLDGTWNVDESLVDWCSGHPLPDRQCGLHFGNCYRSVRCGDKVMQRFCCSSLVKKA